MKPCKIIQIVTKLELGGAQVIVLDLCRKLIAENMEVILITNDEGILVPDAKAIKNLKIYFVPELDRKINIKKDIKCLITLSKILKKEKPYIVHTHSSKAGILGRLAARINKVPIVVHTIHGFAFNESQNAFYNKFIVFLERLSARWADILIAVSYDVMLKGQHKNIGREDQYRVICNGVDISLLRNIKIDKNNKIKELNLDASFPIIGMIACLKPQKSPQDFVKVAETVLQKNKNAQFILIGDGILRNEVEMLINNYELEDNVHLLGWRRDIPDLLSIMDIFVLTSLWEGLPLTVLEAMTCKKPVVVTNIDGNKDIVIDGQNGFLCEPGNIKQMAEKIIYLIENPYYAETMGLSAYRFVQNFDKEKMLDGNIEIYKKLSRKSLNEQGVR
ncbi:MAG: glycosyltransferase family 4 protein [bacterium]